LCLLIIATDGLHYLQRLIDNGPASSASLDPGRPNAELARLVAGARRSAASAE
jgi:hypothetical protein